MTDKKTLLDRLERPLRFASKNAFSQLKNLSGMESLCSTLCKKLAAIDKSPGTKKFVADFLVLFKGFDALPLDEKRRRVERAIEGLGDFKKPAKAIEPSEKGKEEVFSLEPKEGVVANMALSIKYVKGVGEKRAKLFSKMGIENVEEALLFLPSRYEDRSAMRKIGELHPGHRETFKGTVFGGGTAELGGSRWKKGGKKRIYEVVFRDETGTLRGKWFYFKSAYMEKKFKIGSSFIINGEVKWNSYNGALEMIHPDVESCEGEDEELLHVGRITPVYGLTEGLHQKTMRTIMKKVVDTYSRGLQEFLPPSLMKKRNMPSRRESVLQLHFPPKGTSMASLDGRRTPFHERLIFEEFFLLETVLALRKQGVKEEKKGVSFDRIGEMGGKFEKLLPFTLTGAQKRVIGEIEKDMATPKPMNRLVQGDVGSGKTVVAFRAMLIAVDNGYQAALMAPTEILAEQHYKNIRQWGEELGITVRYLASSTKGAERKEVLKELEEGKISIIVGTHALIQEGVVFFRLGLSVIDEQHRFGVMQRGMVKEKGIHCDVLIMTATPIPRTLSMTVYGDLDVSLIDEMPKGRKKIKTRLFFGKKGREVYPILEEEIKKGGQVYMVYPLIEESEKMDLKAATEMARTLQEDIFPRFKVGLVHGRMKNGEKEEIMAAFRKGEIAILVSTTVIEVGVDVPNATIMVIEHAERFGLSQLHQLRGRVGRGDRQAYCFLIAHYPLTDEGKQRLKVMVQSEDGFFIAEKDLEIRGPGEFLGTRQSGMPEFRIANIVRDQDILAEAREEAFRIVGEDPHLEKEENRALKEALRRGWRRKYSLGEIG